MYLKPELLDAPEFAVRRRQNSTGHQPNPQLRLTKKFGGAATGGVFCTTTSKCRCRSVIIQRCMGWSMAAGSRNSLA